MASTAAAFQSLSNDLSVQYLLADIPIYCVGILSLGVFTFFAFMKRTDSVMFCLHISVVVAFIAAILDLVQMLLRGSAAVDEALNLTSVSGIIIAREVGYALSFGLRFLFFWGFVAQPPPGEVPPKGNVTHNGSWGRWGIFGIILQMFTLTLTLVEPVLQILYRNIPSLHKIGPVYEVDAAIQIVLSVIFILKLLLNCWVRMLANSNEVPTRKTLASYTPVIAALLLSIIIGIGDVAMFEFTETVLGRFLQAVELYILIVYMLTASFYHLRRQSWRSASARSSMYGKPSTRGFQDMKSQDQSTWITRPVISSPELLSVVGRDVNVGSPRVVRRGSAISQLSSWLDLRRVSDRISGRRASSSPNQDITALWSPDQAEQGTSPVTRDVEKGPRDSAIDIGSLKSFNQSISQAPRAANWQDPVYTTVVGSARVSTKSPSGTAMIRDYSTRALSPDQPGSVALNPARTPELSKLTIPEPAYPRQTTTETPYVPPSPSIYDAPPSVYGSVASGFDDIVRDISSFDDRSYDGRGLRPAKGSRPRSSRISDLIRQQAELDKSIAALRLLSPDDSSPTSGGRDADDRAARSRSDLSLSNFPVPPWGRASVGTTGSISPPPLPPLGTNLRSAGQANDGQVGVDSVSPVMLTVSDENTDEKAPSVIDVEDAIVTSRSRVNSGGTQYEITSFIGGLTNHQNEPGSFSSMSMLNSPDDGQLAAPTRPWNHFPSDSFGSATSLQPSIIVDHVGGTNPSNSSSSGSPVSTTGAIPPVRAFMAPNNRFSRPVGLPPRPRLVAKDMLSPVFESPSPG